MNRKCCTATVAHVHKRASMGPPSEDGGNWPVDARGTRAGGLQWGRRPRTAEITWRGQRARKRGDCFNGAAVRGRRKSPGLADVVGSLKRLQWGRRPRTAEIAPWLAVEPAWQLASMGPPSENGGNTASRLPLIREALASMGPPSEDGGNPVSARWLRFAPTASMGPPSEDGGNTMKPVNRPKLSLLQWGRRPRTAEIQGLR